MRSIAVLFLTLVSCLRVAVAQTGPAIYADTSLVWKPGYLDICHFHTGRGNAAFCIMPDGTTLLIDAGEIGGSFGPGQTLHIAPLYPNDSVTAGEWLTAYVLSLMPAGKQPVIDYALLTHFHADHYGSISSASPNGSGPYRLSGITTIGDKIPIRYLIDRGHNFPVNLSDCYKNDEGYNNYLGFAGYHKKMHNMQMEALEVGSDKQIRLLHNPGVYPSFMVKGIKCSDTLWDSHTGKKRQLFTAKDIMPEKGFNENPLSLAIKMSYGKFDYFTGGDNTGLCNEDTPSWFDVETPLAASVGEVDVCTFDHHGNRDAMNANLLKTMKPRVLVQQTWSSDHPGQELVHRLGSHNLYKEPRDVFATYIHPETKVTYGSWFVNTYASMEGHVIIRVMPGGTHYFVLVAETHHGKLQLKKAYGPYISR